MPLHVIVPAEESGGLNITPLPMFGDGASKYLSPPFVELLGSLGGLPTYAGGTGKHKPLKSVQSLR